MKNIGWLIFLTLLLPYSAFAELTSPPKLREGPFPFFREDKSGFSQDHRIANKNWITLTIYTEYSSTSPPYRRRYMLEKESIRFDGDWFTVSTLSNSIDYFMNVLNDEGLIESGYGYQSKLDIGIKVNCKEGIVQTPSFSPYKGLILQPLNYYLHKSGWFLTQHETDTKELLSLGGNSREVKQMKKASLYKHLCQDISY